SLVEVHRAHVNVGVALELRHRLPRGLVSRAHLADAVRVPGIQLATVLKLTRDRSMRRASEERDRDRRAENDDKALSARAVERLRSDGEDPMRHAFPMHLCAALLSASIPYAVVTKTRSRVGLQNTIVRPCLLRPSERLDCPDDQGNRDDSSD